MRDQERKALGKSVSDTFFVPKKVSDTFFSRRGFIGAAGLALAAPWAFGQDIRGRAPTREVATTAGRIRGVELDGGIQAFYGVPYGASTGGANRFLPPKAPEPWSGVRETISNGLKERKEQMLRAAYLQNARNDVKVVNFFARQLVESHPAKATLPTPGK